MNPKMFIGRFPMIADLDKAEQATLLEEARHEAFVNLGLSGRAALYMVSCMLFGLAIAIAPPLLLGFTIIVQLTSIVVGIGVSLYLYQRLSRSLLARGLQNVLAQIGRHNWT